MIVAGRKGPVKAALDPTDKSNLIFAPRISRALIKALVPDTHGAGLWLGRHRTDLADRSSFSMPDTPELRAHFGQPGKQKPGCGCPVASLLVMFHAGTGPLLGAPGREDFTESSSISKVAPEKVHQTHSLSLTAYHSQSNVI